MNRKRAIIFGAGGQDGYYLNELLEREGLQVYALRRADCDVGIQGYVAARISAIEPDYVFHLAATSSAKHDAMLDNQKSIVNGTLHILEAVRLYAPEAKVFISGSALQFKNDGSPITETDPFNDGSIYAAQRNASVHFARYYRDNFGMNVHVGYFFHHDSPRRPASNVAQKIAQAAKRIAAGSSEKIEIENLSFNKEWTFAGDTMEAVWLLVNSTVSEAVIGSGHAYSVETWAKLCFSALGLDFTQHVYAAGTGASHEMIVSYPTTIRSLGWIRRVPITELARMMVSA